MGNLSTKELLILDNLMYMDEPSVTDYFNNFTPSEGCPEPSLGDWVQKMNAQAQHEKHDDMKMTSAEEWQRIYDVVNNNERLQNIQISAVNDDHAEGGGGGLSAVFIDKSSNEAVVSFRGTAGGEWKDDFIGGAMTDTHQQENALTWYQDVYKDQNLGQYEITVTGHSKGGNKAKYITILDDTVDNCVSFDGQGFSDEFFDKYADRIAARQSLIENHNADADYVNMLLNDVGDTTYYYGHQYSGKITDFLENHCPNTLFDENMQMTVNPNGQSPITQHLDRLFNSCLRSMDGEDKMTMLAMLGSLVEAGFGGKLNGEYVRDILFDPENKQAATYFLAYTLKYEDAELRKAFDQMGLGVVNQLMDVYHFLESIDTAKWIDGIKDNIIQNWFYEWILQGLKALGINIYPVDLIIIIMQILGRVDDVMGEIRIEDGTGEDRKIGSAAGGRPADFHVHTGTLTDASEALRRVTEGIDRAEKSIDDVYNVLHSSIILRPKRVKKISQQLENEKSVCSKMQSSIKSVASLCERYEQKVIGHAGT